MHLVWYFNEESRFCSGADIFLKFHIQTFRPAVPTISRSPQTAIVYTRSGWFMQAVQRWTRGSHNFTVESQLPETKTLYSGQCWTDLTAFSCAPRTVSRTIKLTKSTKLQFKFAFTGRSVEIENFYVAINAAAGAFYSGVLQKKKWEKLVGNKKRNSTTLFLRESNSLKLGLGANTKLVENWTNCFLIRTV